MRILPENWQEEYLEINGIKEYLLHVKSNASAPVLLYIHGGPGSSETCLSHIIADGIENEYTLVFYDQRGCGYTYGANKKVSPTIQELQSDLLETVLYLKKKYNRDKIGIVGHSFGSVLGLLFAAEHPEHVAFYVGANQVIDFYENELVGYDKLCKAVNQSNNKKAALTLKKIGQYPSKIFDRKFQIQLGKVRRLQGRLGLAVNSNNVLKAYKSSPLYRPSLLKPMLMAMKVNKNIFPEMWKISLKNYSEFQVPVYFILGDKDWQAPYNLAADYLDGILAPKKKSYIIENSGHFSSQDNPVMYKAAMTDILKEAAL